MQSKQYFTKIKNYPHEKSTEPIIYPAHYVIPRHKYPTTPDTFAEHRIFGSWRKRKPGRKIELFIKHAIATVRYAVFRR